MVNLQSFINISSIAVGFVAAICFCVGAATNKAEDIARVVETWLNSNPDHAKSLCAQKAQYLVGALLLIVSFGLQAAAILTAKEIQICVPLLFHSPFSQMFSVLLFASLVAYLLIQQVTKHIERKVQDLLK